jgi:hypothetical protein
MNVLLGTATGRKTLASAAWLPRVIFRLPPRPAHEGPRMAAA